MKRRSFIQSAALGTAAFSAAPLTGCRPKQDHGVSTLPFEDEFELKEMTVEDLQRKLEDGTYTSKRLVEMYSKRIEAIDKSGPALNSVIEMNPEASAIADRLDKERQEGNSRGPLHGIPVMIKDNIDTASLAF